MRNQITENQFKELILSSEPEKVLEKFNDKHHSIAYHFITYNPFFTSDIEKLKLFYNALFQWVYVSSNSNIYDVFRIKTDKDSIHKRLQEQAGDYIIDKIEWLIEKSTSSNNRIKVTALLKNMYMLGFLDHDDGVESPIHESLITNDKILELANKNFESFLKENDSITPQDLIDKNSLLYRFAINSVLKETIDSQGHEFAVSIILSGLINLFKINTKYDPKVILKFFSFKPKKTGYDYDRKIFIDRIESIFGSVEQYKKFIAMSMSQLGRSYLQNYLNEQGL